MGTPRHSVRDQGLGLALVTLALVCGYLGLSDVLAIHDAVVRQVPVVTVRTGGAAMIPAAAAMTAIGVIIIIRLPLRWHRGMFLLAIGWLILAPVAALTLHIWSGSALPAQGYRRCGAVAGMRFLTSIWARGEGQGCPDHA